VRAKTQKDSAYLDSHFWGMVGNGVRSLLDGFVCFLVVFRAGMDVVPDDLQPLHKAHNRCSAHDARIQDSKDQGHGLLRRESISAEVARLRDGPVYVSIGQGSIKRISPNTRRAKRPLQEQVTMLISYCAHSQPFLQRPDPMQQP
jgi:hypothetical protein